MLARSTAAKAAEGSRLTPLMVFAFSFCVPATGAEGVFGTTLSAMAFALSTVDVIPLHAGRG